MKIYVVGSSKNKFLQLDNIREKFLIDKPHAGDNIDYLNPWYCELTGLYYLWKHVNDDIVGLEHYRRYFVNSEKQLLGENEIKDLLKNCDILTNRSTEYSATKPVKTWLIKNNKWNEMEKFLLLLKYYVGKDYSDLCRKYLDGDHYSLCNMFIAKKEVINEYCEFIFDVMNVYKLAEEYYNRKLPPRICGYLSEFTFGAWIIWKKKKNKFVARRLVRC